LPDITVDQVSEHVDTAKEPSAKEQFIKANNSRSAKDGRNKTVVERNTSKNYFIFILIHIFSIFDYILYIKNKCCYYAIETPRMRIIQMTSVPIKSEEENIGHYSAPNKKAITTMNHSGKCN